MRLWPRSLTGQMALLIALALFVAQAINFGLAYRERVNFRLAAATRPVAVRISDALERETRGERAILPDRGRIRRLPTDPILPLIRRRPEVARELRQQLTELGVRVGRIDTGLQGRSDEDAPARGEVFAPGNRRPSTLTIAIEQPGRGWLVVRSGWPEPGPRLLVALMVQTLILYAITLLPVLWITRRIARPLRTLTAAAGSFDPHAANPTVTEEGPADLRQLIAAFNALRLRVVAMLDEKNRMLGAIGHDLRTPLAALRVRIESVEDETDRARMADTVIEMDRTLDDILSLARVGRPSEPPTEVDLTALVDAVTDDFHAIGADVTLVDNGRVLFRLRPNPMRRAVRNLIENAIKYGQRAGVRIENGPREVVIVVTDDGPGIPADRLDSVFDPFVRLEASRNRDSGGIGLGLALARSIVREAGGDIRLVNRPEGGLEARIVLRR